MQKIINEIKLDFDDVLIKPKRSSLNSRFEVNLVRDFNFAHSTRKLSCVPIMVANMDTTGTFGMTNPVCSAQSIVCLHKHYSIEELIAFYSAENNIDKDLVFYSTGTSTKDIEKLAKV